MITVIRPNLGSQISPPFFAAEVVLICLPMAVYLFQVSCPALGLAQAFGFGQPLFYCMSFFENFLPVILFFLAFCMDLSESTWTNARGVIAGYLACLLCLTIFSNAFPSAADACLRDRFTSKRWKDSLVSRSREEVRLYMVGDLLFRYRLKGKSRKEIDELLGVPSVDGDSTASENEYVYFLGYPGLPAPDLQHLALTFENGVVTRVCWEHHM